ncbi:MAG: dTDP-4-dehydrorhamnose reductase [Deltaproteobacteria bacterium]|nr:dTDP-4-dehydrorhamnose reductase [Deltaproteobacteria bacterium]MBW1956224.1 dTDP-4-dehydrorhamnose reductase [Deltaproteobacteria bacterium]MBW2041057.1 dTDP-4-dehydrorhamnose reductase [Deltaproteobacteria bacterium]MBW2133333.1 dTDP-4-dehydrorhamnose reductase [Deltaproteobacteria bacterium]
MTLAILGCNGQLGRELALSARIKGLAAAGADLPEVDITEAASVRSFIASVRPSVVVNAAAYTQVDQAESDPQTAFAVNAKGPERLARLCAQRRLPLIHISTDYVFDGKGEKPYREDDPVNPLGVYGRSKEEGEQKIRSCWGMHIIIRTAWLYSPFGQNFVKTMLRLGKERKELRVVADQYGSPTCAADLARAIVTIIETLHRNPAPPWGTYHFTGLGITTWHGFAKAVFAEARRYMPLKVMEVIPVPTREYPTPALRPGYSVLDCTRIQRLWNATLRPWEESLKETLHRIFKEPGETDGI